MFLYFIIYKLPYQISNFLRISCHLSMCIDPCHACCCSAILLRTFNHQAKLKSVKNIVYCRRPNLISCYLPSCLHTGFHQTTCISHDLLSNLIYNFLRICYRQPISQHHIRPINHLSISLHILLHLHEYIHLNHWPCHQPIDHQIYLHQHARTSLFHELYCFSIPPHI